MSEQQETCETCRYSLYLHTVNIGVDGDVEDVFRCRRYPPNNTPAIVAPGNWCGEHQPAEKGGEA